MKPTIALFLHQPKCSVQCGNGMIRALQDHFNFKIFARQELESDFFDNVDIVAVPGGIGDSESFSYLMAAHKSRIRKFVANGGRYLGICMGAYWAGSHYFDLLEDVDAVQYITQPNTCTHRPHAKAMPINWLGDEHKMFFYDGCALVGDQTKFKTVATYSNGDAMAIYQNRIGIIGCHPESEPHWYTSYSWMRNHWHDYQHHRLLLDFVDNLMLQ